MSADWGAALRFAVRGLGLSPDAFWGLSVAEWRLLTGTGAALGRGELEALMVRFPDGVVDAAHASSDGAA